MRKKQRKNNTLNLLTKQSKTGLAWVGLQSYDRRFHNKKKMENILKTAVECVNEMLLKIQMEHFVAETRESIVVFLKYLLGYFPSNYDLF